VKVDSSGTGCGRQLSVTSVIPLLAKDARNGAPIANGQSAKRSDSCRRFSLRYTLEIVKRIVSVLLLILLLVTLGLTEDTSFQHVKVPDTKGRQAKAVLTFSDQHKAVEIRPVKGTPVTIPYAAIDRCAYEFTKQFRVNEGTVATAPFGVGVVMMLMRSKSHWLEIDYHAQDIPKSYVLRMEKHEYLHILDALKSHAGVDAQILGNADKR